MDFDRKETPSDSVPANLPQRRNFDMVMHRHDCKANRKRSPQKRYHRSSTGQKLRSALGWKAVRPLYLGDLLIAASLLATHLRTETTSAI